MNIVDVTDLALPVRIDKRVGTLTLSGIFEAFIWSKIGWRRLRKGSLSLSIRRSSMENNDGIICIRVFKQELWALSLCAHCLFFVDSA